MVGKVPVGGDAPISVQSMTNTRTTDVEATVAQIRAIERAGADMVRVSVPTMDAAEAFRERVPVQNGRQPLQRGQIQLHLRFRNRRPLVSLSRRR